MDYKKALEDAQKSMAKRPLGGPLTLVPGLRNTEPAYWELAEDLEVKLNHEFPQSRETDSGLEYPAITTDFSELRNVMGIHPIPSGTPPADRKEILRNHPGWQRLVPEDVAIVKELIRLLVTGEVATYSIPLKRDASSGLPSMVKDPQTKMNLIRPWLERPEEMWAHVRTKNMVSLANEGIVPAYFNAYRVQPDGFVDGKPKARVVFDWKGAAVQQDKTLPGSDRMVRCRTRTVSAGSLSGLYPLRLVARSCQMARSRFDFAFKHYSADDITAKIGGKSHIACYDVSNHDYFVPYEVIDLMEQALREKFRPEVGDLFSLALRAPMLIGADYPGLKEARFRGDPLNAQDYKFDYGNTSGNPLTTEIAMIAGAFYGLSVLRRNGLLTSVEDTLKGIGPVRLLIAGDNLVFASDVEVKVELPYCKISKSPSFLGNVFSGSRSDVIPSLASLPIKFFCADGSIDSPRRRYWAFGYLERLKYFGRHPLMTDMVSIIDEVTRDHLGESISDLAKRNLVLPDVEVGTDAALEFLMNPDTVHYKTSLSDIPRELVEKVFISITPAMNAKLAASLHKEVR